MIAERVEFEGVPFPRGIIRKVITEANTTATPFDLDWCERKPVPDGYSDNFAFFENMSVPDLSEAISLPSVLRDCSNLASTTFWGEFEQIDLKIGRVAIAFVDLRDLRPAEAASSLNELCSPSNYDEQSKIDESLGALESLTEQMKNFIPLTRSSNLVNLAKRAVAAMSERTTEDVDEWARKLAKDIKNAPD
jgi:hypothetical protein